MELPSSKALFQGVLMTAFSLIVINTLKPNLPPKLRQLLA